MGGVGVDVVLALWRSWPALCVVCTEQGRHLSLGNWELGKDSKQECDLPAEKADLWVYVTVTTAELHDKRHWPSYKSWASRISDCCSQGSKFCSEALPNLCPI